MDDRNIKIVFFDFDNTLFSHKSHSIPQTSIESLNKLSKKGIITCLCTGRCRYELDHYFDLSDLKFDYYILFNGLQIEDRNKKLIYADSMKGTDQDNIIKLFNKKKIPLIIADDEDYYLNFVNDHVISAMKAISSPIPDVHDFNSKNIYMCSIFYKDAFDESIKNKFPNCYYLKWCDGVYDIVLNGHSKADAIDLLINKLKIKVDETMSFGDGENDISMLTKTKISVAMGNADDNVKKVADYITADIDDDGLYKALKYYEII